MALQSAVLLGTDSLALEGLHRHLAALPDLFVVEEVTTARDAIAALQAHRPRLLFLVGPEHFPNGGLELSRWVRQCCPAVKLVVITGRAQVDLFFAYADLEVGAYFQNGNPGELIEDVRRVLAGQTVLDRRLVDGFARFLQKPLGQAVLRAVEAADPCRGGTGQVNGKPARREAVVRLAGLGWTNREIAAELRIAESTVAEHLKRYRAQAGPIRRAALGRSLANGV